LLYTAFTTLLARNFFVLRLLEERYVIYKRVARRINTMRNLTSKPTSPTVTIRVAGSLSQGHLSYLDQLVASAIECALWPLLDLERLEELDRVALMYLVGGEGREFGIVSCPDFVREWMYHEKQGRAA
jgi:hypothetical protein